jgi:hypothetical protein
MNDKEKRLDAFMRECERRKTLNIDPLDRFAEYVNGVGIWELVAPPPKPGTPYVTAFADPFTLETMPLTAMRLFLTRNVPSPALAHYLGIPLRGLQWKHGDLKADAFNAHMRSVALARRATMPSKL